MKKTFILIYAGIAYLLAMANIGYIVAFLADFGAPKTINSGAFGGDIWQAVLINALLVLGFGMHHSITARTTFKRWWTRFVPTHMERATYLYMTAAMTGLLVVLWQPIPITLWRVETTWAIAAIVSLYLTIWLVMFAATFHFGHFSFFGFAQAWQRVRERQVTGTSFSANYLYAIMRHPISCGWMVAPWVTPHMTVGQLVFALSATAYVLVATWFEEADLVDEFGDRYLRYRQEVPAFLPRLGRQRSDRMEQGTRDV